MNYYLTPIKQQSNHKLAKSNTQNRAQDWICVVCNNLNFSFRKKCNRCKTQTRYQNQNHVVNTTYSQYYYQAIENVGRQDQIKYHADQRVKQNFKSPLSDITNLFTPQAKNKSSQNNTNIYLTVQNKKQLNPTLSQLAKQYCPKDIRTQLENKQSSIKKQHFANQFWEFIHVRDFDECLDQDQKGQMETMRDQNNQGQSQDSNQRQRSNQENQRKQNLQIEAELERMFEKILLD